MPKPRFKRKAKKAITSSTVKSIVMRMDPNALPPFKSIFNGHFKTKLHRTTAHVNAIGGAGGPITSTIISGLPASGGVPQSATGSIAFSLSELDLDATAYQALYDQYRIVGVRVTFIPQYNFDQANTSAVAYCGDFYSVVDYDDSNAPTSLAYIRSYENVKQTNTMTKHVHKFIPRIAMAAYNSNVVFNNYANQGGQWLDMNSPTTPHFGVKWLFSGTAGNNIPSYTVESEVMVEFREVR